MARSAVVGSAIAVAPLDFVLRPLAAYAAICNCSGSECDCSAACCDGYTEFCCTMTGSNACPAGSVAAGWWKVDSSGFCGGDARYYIDCNVAPGANPCMCECADGRCENRKSCCTVFRYGQCHQELPAVGAIVCRVVTCTPPWVLDPACTSSPVLVDNNTASHHAACLEPSPPSLENDMPTLVVRRLLVNPEDPGQGYILDSQGGIHPFGGAIPSAPGVAYWNNMAPAVDLVIVDWSIPSGYTLDARGAIHPFGGLPAPEGGPYWPRAFIPPVPPT